MVRAHELVEKKRTNARTYSSMLPDGLVTKPVEKEYCRHSYWMYSVLLKKNPLNLMEELQTRFGIETRPFFRPVHLMPPYLKDRENNFPVARYLSESGISLPSSTLLDKDDIGYICESLIQLLEEEK